MRSVLRPALTLFLLFTLVGGVIYPVVVTLIGQAAFPHAANGSRIHDGRGRIIGSELIGQPFADPRYFWSRPSVTAPYAYNASASAASNLGPTNPALHDAVAGRIAALHAADPGNTARVPIDLVTTSGSGLDPHISPAAAYYQVPRVARTRRLDPERVRDLVESLVEGRLLGVLGEPRINVLRLNQGLEALAAAPTP